MTVKRLTDDEKNIHYWQLWGLTQQSYSPVQLPQESLFRRTVSRGDVFAIIDGDALVGYALVDAQECPILLRSIAVNPRYRSMGHGRALLDEVANYYRSHGWSRLLLHVMEHNPAQKLYFDAGWRVTKVLKGYYKPEGNGLEMEKVL